MSIKFVFFELNLIKMNSGFLNFFNQVFVKKKGAEPLIQFGHYSDRNKTVEQIRLWKKSLTSYKSREFFEAIDCFFKYIKDPELDNLFYELKENTFTFNFFQGSKRIFGTIDENIIYAYSDVLIYSELSDSFMQYILELNHKLKFSKFLISENNLLKIELKLETKFTNPISLYSALREIAIIADEYDDLLTQKYSFLKSINTKHVESLPADEINVKIKYYRKWITETLKSVEKYNAVKFVGARSFLLLHLIYKLHFLLSPEGELLQEIYNAHRIFYKNTDITDFEKNAIIIRIIKKLSNWSDEEIKKSLYFVYSTFPISPPVDFHKVIDFASNEIDKIHWYDDNEHKDVARAVAEYIVGYACFNFGMLPIMSEIFYVFWETLYHEYFSELNFKNIPVINNSIDYNFLNQGFNSLNSMSNNNFPKLNFNIKHLNIVGFSEFAISYIYEFINLDFTEKTANK